MSARPDREYRARIAAAIMDPSPEAHPCELDAAGARRFRIYRNNVHRALDEALADAYPVVRRLVGDPFFFAMAREYARSERTRPPSLALYGRGFPRFVETFPPAASVEYLADVARLERAWLEALHAADAPSLDAATLATAGEALVQVRFTPHPAARLVASPHPVVSIWRANRDGAPSLEIAACAEHALVTRPALTVRVTRLDRVAGGVVRRLMDGASAADAFGHAAATQPPLEVTTLFASLLEAGAFTRATLEGDTDHEHR